MISDGNKGSFATDLSVRVGSGQQNLNSYQTLAAQRDEVENSIMEMEGRGYSDIYRNSSEDLFLKSLMESSIGMPIPTMEMLGLKNLSQNFRTDSEELFKSWLTTGENHGHNSSNIPHRTRQVSRRMSTELVSSSSQQHDGMFQKKRSDSYMPQNISVAEDLSSEFNPPSIRNAVERGLQASNLYLAKAWFHSSQPMTRSRSSELRRKYVAMQNSQTTIGMEAMHNASGQGVNNLKQEFVNPNGFSEASMCQIPNQLGVFMSPSNSSSSTFNNTPQMDTVDKVSSVVSMLKGTLERKKLNNYFEKEAVEDSSNGLYSDQEFMIETRLDQGQGNQFHEMPAVFQEVSAVQHIDPAVLQADERPIDLDLEGFLTPTNQNQLSTISQEPSQSESSAAAPVVSSGFEACDGPSNSGQTLSISECSRKQVGSSRISEKGSKSKDFRDHIFDNLKEDRKRGSLVRYGSSTSAGSVDKGDPTKKRRVERSRKMAEAKEKSSTPAIPSDMQAVLKRCENLEKEVRSLKLNLSFMNRKDSEQTKQIEELQMQNEELADEKERLLEEIERIISKIGKI